MAGIVTLVSSRLTTDLDWREAELAIMRKNLHGTTEGSAQEAALLRANLAMLYAHYEGFCKYAIELYIDSVERLKIRRGDLCWPLLTYSLAAFQSTLNSEPERKAFFSTILNDFNGLLDDVATYERPGQISNLWPDLLLEWLARLGLEDAEVLEQQVLLASLVSNRNLIAHGKRVQIDDRKQFEKYYRAATNAMHGVAIGVVDSFDKGAYKRRAPLSVTINAHP
ncbi:MAE_28990/MAE_18760 family HEPN-like nuclease [Stenotrophomonas sp. PS02289]|uniref:MAE_28990/MAE_18760 family HEPN-like nuclease n=1 Tax=Stenotrophomonas sp. PS02289 TaxID=2991422 RepID=UPI00249BAE40|nr:MAE_28990/MAE_18760 family HEPN-like nuclease [Stenotrophomonas sp. PS02289]